MTSAEPAARFEELLAQLQQTVSALENEQLTLEESIAAYERSVALANACAEMLDEAELRISRIDRDSKGIRDEAVIYRASHPDVARLLLGEDDGDDLDDLIGLDED